MRSHFFEYRSLNDLVTVNCNCNSNNPGQPKPDLAFLFGAGE
jgi:hypothetical protein